MRIAPSCNMPLPLINASVLLLLLPAGMSDVASGVASIPLRDSSGAFVCPFCLRRCGRADQRGKRRRTVSYNGGEAHATCKQRLSLPPDSSLSNAAAAAAAASPVIAAPAAAHQARRHREITTLFTWLTHQWQLHAPTSTAHRFSNALLSDTESAVRTILTRMGEDHRRPHPTLNERPSSPARTDAVACCCGHSAPTPTYLRWAA